MVLREGPTSGMDATTAKMVEFAARIRYEDLPPQVVHQAKRLIIDALGCAVGGAEGPPSRIARELAAEHSGVRGARVLGLAQRTTPEMAAFANSVMVRYLDFNDGFGVDRHPSDMISGILAVADAFHVTGRDTILGVVAAYETNWGMPVPFMQLGWDQGVSVALGVSVGAGVVLGLTEEQIGHAMSMAITPNIPLRVTRSGELSMWKGVATAAASRSAVFAALLAAKGMTGPHRVFEGRNGLWEQVSGPFEVDIDPQRNGFGIQFAKLKSFPAAGMTHAVLTKVIEMARGLPLEEIEAIEVRTYATLVFECGGEPEKWDPQTRETADHSLPYVMAMGLRHGTVTVESFTDEAISDSSLRPLMDKIRIVENPEFTAARDNPALAATDPAKLGVSEIEITTRSAKRLVARTGIVRGHHLNPMTDADIESKFRGMADPVSTPRRVAGALEALWELDQITDVGTALDKWGSVIAAR